MQLATGFCPVNYCDYNDQFDKDEAEVRLPQSIEKLDRAICGRTRTGFLCGVCREGFTTHFHSPDFQCKLADPTLCKVGWLFYILSELVPVTLVFITVLVLNISFTSGAANGFILFSQLVYSLKIDQRGLLKLPISIKVLTYVYEIIYGFFNMDFFDVDSLSFCLWPNASALDMLAFKYVTIVYVFFLIFSVIWMINKCGGRCLGRWWRITTLKSSVIHGITAFLIICYAQCLKVSLTLITGYNYNLRDESKLEVRRVVWLNGNLFYFRGWHLLYALPALVFLLTIGILPPLLLLVYPVFNKVLDFFGWEESKPINFISRKLRINRLKPLLDSFQGCFKDNLRFFAGLYFFYRWIGLTLDATVSSYGIFYTLVEVSLVLILALHAICQPYTKRIHNIIDTLLFADLAIINAISFANYYVSQTSRHMQTIEGFAVVQLVLIYLPFVTVVVCILVFTCKLFHWGRREEENMANGQNSFSLKAVVHHSHSSVRITPDEEEHLYQPVASDVDSNNFKTTSFTSVRSLFPTY